MSNTELFAGLISFLSLIIASLTLSLQRKHNRLQLAPVPWLAFGDYDDSIYVCLQNKGGGPLLIKKLVVTNDINQEYTDFISALGAVADSVHWEDFVQEFENRCVAPGETLDLIKVSGQSCGSNDSDKLRHTLSTLTLNLIFTDLYQQKLPPYSRRLAWFGRTITKN